ncbi:hypothetical protein B9Z55_021111 [Caenorhabditis nigoni]|uniref:Uncharacterized protein n=1 Tax=Caenorhabditis nigoni TaxID=1611254 RepID=A0A2G5TR42_9PELO|nr:hypothetical protein B9Z55_021111 [Caenorhabditis nigoni]
MTFKKQSLSKSGKQLFYKLTRTKFRNSEIQKFKNSKAILPLLSFVYKSNASFMHFMCSLFFLPRGFPSSLQFYDG